MDISQIIRMPDPRENITIELREVVRDLDGRPHVLIRVRLSGWHFPERAPEPFLVIGKIVSRFVLIGPEGTIADAYFNVRLPAAKGVSFGYGHVISWDFDVKVDPTKIIPLDRKRLPKRFVDLEG